MKLLRFLGLYLSLAIMAAAHEGRFILNTLFGRRGLSGVRVIIVDERRVLLVSHWYAPGVWTLPGGGIAQAESLDAAAIREVQEETGLVLGSIAGEIGTYTGSMGANDVVTVVYSGDFAGSLSRTPNIEIMARSWFDLDNLPLELSPANRKRIEAYKSGVRNEKGKW